MPFRQQDHRCIELPTSNSCNGTADSSPIACSRSFGNSVLGLSSGRLENRISQQCAETHSEINLEAGELLPARRRLCFGDANVKRFLVFSHNRSSEGTDSESVKTRWIFRFYRGGHNTSQRIQDMPDVFGRLPFDRLSMRLPTAFIRLSFGPTFA